MNVSPDDVERARRAALRCAELFRLPFRRELWRGGAGNWAGAGIGSSIDFQDHRPYVPGDDPRYIDWQAYARSDHYVMKLYREEVSPAVDLVLDASSSMSASDAKKLRSLELFYFAIESAVASGASVKVWVVAGGGAHCWDVATVSRDTRWLASEAGRVDASLLQPVDFRQSSLRVLVSDCLFPGEPSLAVNALSMRKGRGIVLAPFAAEESEPDWLGQVELEDYETGMRRVEHIDDARLEHYRAAYSRHFQMWESTCRRRGIPFARIPAEADLSDTLRQSALRVSAVEPAA